MDQYAQVTDIFDPTKKEYVQQNSALYVGALDYCLQKCKLLAGAQEADAVPYMLWLIEIIEQLLEVEDFFTLLEEFPNIKKALIEIAIPNIARIIIEVKFQ